MRSAFRVSAVLMTFLVTFTLASGSYSAQEETAEQKYENVQVLKDIPAQHFTKAMLFMATSLGVECSYCHTENDRADDSKPEKRRAREMLRMVQAINASTFSGEQTVTCYTCHRGQVRPVSAIQIPRVHPSISAATVPAGTIPPTVDAVIDRYIEASGGRAALEALRSRTATGTFRTNTIAPVPAELYLTPDAMLDIRRLESDLAFGIDADGAWRRSGDAEPADISVHELARLRYENDLLLPLRLRSHFVELNYAGPGLLDGRPVAILEGRIPTPGTHISLYFNAVTGLLDRMFVSTESSFGLNPLGVLDYFDYRDVDGVMVPFTIRRTFANGNWQATSYSSVVHNRPVDPARLRRP